MTKKFLRKQENFVKNKKKTQKVQETQPTTTNNKNHGTEENKYIQPKFFNFSETTLSKCQTNIVLIGLKLIPTPKSKSIQLTCDPKAFANKPRQTEYFDDHNLTLVNQTNESLVQGNSNFYPPRNRNKELETHIRFMYNIDITNEKSNKNSYFSPKEWTELRNLMTQPDIVIKEADKAETVTVLHKSHYRAMIFEHLNKQNTYQKLDKNLDPTIMKKFKNLLNKHKNISIDKEFKYLITSRLTTTQSTFTASLKYTSPDL